MEDPSRLRMRFASRSALEDINEGCSNGRSGIAVE